MKYLAKSIQKYDYFNGENFIYFDIIDIDKKNKSIALIIQDNGRITQRNFDIKQDKKGKYFEYEILTKIYLKNFKEII